MLISRFQQARLSDAVQGIYADLMSQTFPADSVSVGTFLASKTLHTKMALWWREQRSCGEKNVSQKDMIRVLNEEGYDIKERELMRVRAKNRWLLRVPNGTKPGSYPAMAMEDEDEGIPNLPGASLVNSPRHVCYAEALICWQHEDERQNGYQTGSGGLPSMSSRADSPELSPEVRHKRHLRLQKLQEESEERWATRKRRRRTRGWAGLPADPPGPPRFPSETTLDESKAFLNLDNDSYRMARDKFQAICEEEGVIKKTLAGPEKWQAVKDRLVRETPQLQAVFWSNEPHKLEQRTLALDVICLDVTKRMRTLERRMTIADAKNILAINPEESRQVRNSFYATLKSDHFTSKLEAGDEHWNELKARWIAGSDTLQRILAPGAADPQHATKVKAVEVLCRDVMKRLRDDQAKKDPNRRKQVSNGPGPGPAKPKLGSMQESTANAGFVPTAPLVAPNVNKAPMTHPNDLQIDPSLLLAASDPSVAGAQHHHHQYGAAAFMPPQYPPQPAPIPVFFRLNPHSQVQQQGVKLWLGTLSSGSVSELRQLARKEYPSSAVMRIDGVVKDPSGNDLSYRIDHDDELDAYLAHTTGGKATFIVQLAEGFA